jgi:hypothetical protein
MGLAAHPAALANLAPKAGANREVFSLSMSDLSPADI